MVVLVVVLEVPGQRVDPAGQDRDLDFRRTGIARWRALSSMISCFFSAVTDISFTPRHREG
jgi:hypothetical protein